jgi:hypothetical protein
MTPENMVLNDNWSDLSRTSVAANRSYKAPQISIRANTGIEYLSTYPLDEGLLN